MTTDNPVVPIVEGKQISNPFSTGGGGMRFETQVQASFAVLMLATGFAPCLPCRPIQKIVLQAQWTKRRTDDLIVFTSNPDLTDERKLHVQIKHALSLTEANATFAEVIHAMWLDFNNAELFSRSKDALALVTGPLSATDIDDTRTILEWARHSATAEEFLTKVDTVKFSSNGKREKLKAFRHHLGTAAKSPVSDNELFQFLRHFHLLGYDLDVRSGVMHALLHTIIARHAPESAESVWARVVQEIQSADQNGGTVTVEFFPDDLRGLFAAAEPEAMPAGIASTLPPSSALTWNSPEFAPALVTVNLLGACDEGLDADMAIVRDLSQDDPVKWLRTMREVLQLSDSPVALRGKTWTVKNREELWMILATRVFSEHLKLLENAAKIVLSEPDPQFELERERRFAATVYGKTLNHSQAARRGVAETLALLGSRSELLTNCPEGSSAGVAAVVTRDILHSAHWIRWGSLNDLLPLLAEASPGAFLDAVEHALGDTPCPFDRLFAEEGNGVVGRNYLTGSLWALETLAWEEQYLVRATVALGGLAARDPGGQWSNRPGNSLTMIFLPWLPQTMASEEKQLVAIRTLLREHSDAAWDLLLSLMPRETAMSHGAHKPRWRAFVPKEGVARPTIQEYQNRVTKLAELAVEAAGTSAKRLKKLISHIDQLPDSVAMLVLAKLESNEIAGLPGDSRFELWQSLTQVAQKHRRHADSKWAKPSEWVTQIEGAAAKLAPREPEILHRGLFRKDRSSLYERSGDWAQQDKEIADRQRAAVTEIIAAQGVKGALSFAKGVEMPSSVGFAMGTLDQLENRERWLRDLLNDSDTHMSKVADGFVYGNYLRGQISWLDGIDISGWSPDEIAALLVRLPSDTETWQRVDRLLGPEARRYWERVQVNPYQVQGDIYIAVDALMKYGRPRAALDCLARVVHDKKVPDRSRSIDALLSAVSSQERMNALDPYDAGCVITALQNSPQAETADLIAVEWAYLPILNDNNSAAPLTLDRTLASNPDFFCEVIRMVFRSRRGQEGTPKPTAANVPSTGYKSALRKITGFFAETLPRLLRRPVALKEPKALESTGEQQAKARNAYELLRQWRTIPGTSIQGEVSRDALMEWIDNVKESTQKSGHFVVAMQQAGEVFRNAPGNPDGLWMHHGVAEVLNRPDMDELRKGYSIGVHNSRGVHWVDPTGTPEKELAETYAKRASQIENAGFHRLAGTLRSISESYTRESQIVIRETQDEEVAEG